MKILGFSQYDIGYLAKLIYQFFDLVFERGYFVADYVPNNLIVNAKISMD